MFFGVKFERICGKFWKHKAKRMVSAINSGRFRAETGSDGYRDYPAWSALAQRTIKWKAAREPQNAKHIWQYKSAVKEALQDIAASGVTGKWNILELPGGLEYAAYPNATRELFIFTDEDESEIADVVDGVIGRITRPRRGRR